MAEWIVNLGEAAEYMFDHNIFQDNLVGVDFCEQMVKETNPGVLGQGRADRRPRTPSMHGYRTIADIMRALNPFTGEFYREALQMSRLTREMFCLMEGRHVHPSTLYPGGVGTVPTLQLFTDYLVRLMKYVEFMKKVVPLHDDLFDFFYEALPGYEEVGQRRILLGCWGSFNDPDVCDYTYENMNEWGKAMYVTPGVVVDGELVTTDLVDINLGIRILLGSSFYDDWEDGETFVKTRPAGQPGRSAASLEPDHHAPAAEARLRRQVHLGHVAALVRQAHRRPPGARHRRRPDRPALGHGAGRPGRHRLRQGDRPQRQDLPAQDGDAAGGRVRVEDPEVEQRHRARPGPHLLPGLRGGGGPATSSSRRWRSCTPAGRKTWTEFKVPDEAIGCGFHEAVRGVLSHHVVIRDGKIANYHPYPPTPWNASPRDVYGTPGPYEDAVQNTPIFEENGPDKFKGIDIMRAVRSFDPCLPCGVHMYLGDGKVLEVQHVPMFGVQE